MTITKGTKAMMLDQRICFCCGETVASRAGVVCADLAIIVHDGKCHDRVKAERRVFDRSRRGRLRSPRQVLDRLTRKPA